jgi:hypothetical protein
VNGVIKGTNITASGNITVGSATLSTPSGPAPLFGIRAWGSVATNGTLSYGGNIASVSKTGADFTVTFATAMTDVSYSVVAVNNGNGDFHARPHALAAGSFKVTVTNNTAGFYFMVIR